MTKGWALCCEGLFVSILGVLRLLDKSNIALFALRITLCHAGEDIFESAYMEQYSCHSSRKLFCFNILFPQVVLSDDSNIALFAPRFTFCHAGEIPFSAGGTSVQGVQYYDQSWTELFFFLNVCSQDVLFDKSDIALFAFRLSFCHMGDIFFMHTACVTLHPFRQSVCTCVHMWRSTWNCTVERSQTNVTDVIFHHLTQSTIVTLHPLKPFTHTKKHGGEKINECNLCDYLPAYKSFCDTFENTHRRETSAKNVNICLYMKTAWDHIWKHNKVRPWTHRSDPRYTWVQ